MVDSQADTLKFADHLSNEGKFSWNPNKTPNIDPNKDFVINASPQKPPVHQKGPEPQTPPPQTEKPNSNTPGATPKTEATTNQTTNQTENKKPETPAQGNETKTNSETHTQPEAKNSTLRERDAQLVQELRRIVDKLTQEITTLSSNPKSQEEGSVESQQLAIKKKIKEDLVARMIRLQNGHPRIGDRTFTTLNLFFEGKLDNARVSFFSSLRDEVTGLTGGEGKRTEQPRPTNKKTENDPAKNNNNQEKTDSHSNRNTILSSISARLRGAYGDIRQGAARAGESINQQRQASREQADKKRKIDQLLDELGGIITGAAEATPDGQKDPAERAAEIRAELLSLGLTDTEINTQVEAYQKRQEKADNRYQEAIKQIIEDLTHVLGTQGPEAAKKKAQEIWERVSSDPDFRDSAAFLALRLLLTSLFGPLGAGASAVFEFAKQELKTQRAMRNGTLQERLFEKYNVRLNTDLSADQPPAPAKIKHAGWRGAFDEAIDYVKEAGTGAIKLGREVWMKLEQLGYKFSYLLNTKHREIGHNARDLGLLVDAQDTTTGENSEGLSFNNQELMQKLLGNVSNPGEFVKMLESYRVTMRNLVDLELNDFIITGTMFPGIEKYLTQFDLPVIRRFRNPPSVENMKAMQQKLAELFGDQGDQQALDAVISGMTDRHLRHLAEQKFGEIKRITNNKDAYAEGRVRMILERLQLVDAAGIAIKSVFLDMIKGGLNGQPKPKDAAPVGKAAAGGLEGAATKADLGTYPVSPDLHNQIQEWMLNPDNKAIRPPVRLLQGILKFGNGPVDQHKLNVVNHLFIDNNTQQGYQDLLNKMGTPLSTTDLQKANIQAALYRIVNAGPNAENYQKIEAFKVFNNLDSQAALQQDMNTVQSFLSNQVTT